MNRALLFVIVLIVGSHGALVSAKPAVASQSASESVASASNQVVVGSPQAGVPVGVVSHSQPQAQQPQSLVVGEYSPHGNHYAPAGIINAVGVEHKRNFEQYGQPESTGMPPNYKPFGSWGLYIGGNPADGYYTNYYKSLSAAVESSGSPKPSSVEKQASPVKPLSVVGYAPGEYVPYAYSHSEFAPAHQQQYSPQSSGVESSGPESYAKKSVFESPQSSPVKPKEGKSAVYGAPQPVYVYGASPYAYASVPSPSVPVQSGVSQSVVPYPVPVGSHILGSQPGIEGSFYPYGVHGFTKYVVKPVAGESSPSAAPGYATPVVPIEKAASGVQQQVVSSSSSSSGSSGQQGPVYSPSQFAVSNPSYKVQYYPYYSPQHHHHQQQYQYQYHPQQQSYAYSYQPYYYASGNYYGYPVNQIHYSPASGEQSLVAMSQAEQQQQSQSGVHPNGGHSSAFQHQFGPVGVKPVPSIYVDGKMPVEEVSKSEQPSVEKKAKA